MRNMTLDDLTLKGINVSTSALTQWAYRAAYCDLLLNITARNQSAALATFKKAGVFGDYSGLRISGVKDLGFLKDFPSLLYLEVLGPTPVNVRQLDVLTNLRGLRLESPGCGLDFACFKELEVFIGDWHVENCNVDKSQELRQLHIWHFKPRSRDLCEFAGVTRLEKLAITQTSIRSLYGLEMLEDVRTLDIAYAPKLETVSELATPDCGIRELSFENAKKIESYAPIASIPKLRRLMLTACASMKNLKWTAGMNRLDFFSFVDTNVVGGDLSPLLDLPKLRYAGTLDKKHYNYTSAALNQILDGRFQGIAKRDAVPKKMSSSRKPTRPPV
jgi:hypothetical protein